MNIETYRIHLKELLQGHKYKPYERQAEGVVFVGPPETLNILEKKEKYEFVYLLCMFMAFDLKTFEIYNQFYLSLKNEFYIPKFEYGLTNAFVYPNRVFADYKIGIIEEYFNNSFNTFYSFTNELTNKIDKNFDINFLLNSILEDTDLKFGLFGTTFVKRIEMKMQQNNE